MNNVYQEIIDAVVNGDEILTEEIVTEYLKGTNDPIGILNEGIIKGAQIVGNLFEEGEYFLSDLMLAGNAVKAGMEVITPVLEKLTGVKGQQGKIIIATVETDIHDIGKNIVSTMFLSSGYKVIDLGVDVSGESILDEAIKENVDIIALSALMTTSRPYMKDTVLLIKNSSIKDKVKVIVGGGAVDANYSKNIGADGYTDNAIKAVQLVDEMLKEN